MEQDRREQEEIEALTSVVSSIFTHLNVGLLIYQLEAPAEPGMLRLVYVNEAASRYTGADLSKRTGRYILDAFPGLAGSDLPSTYAEVASGGKSVDLGSFEYPGDDAIGHGFYSVKAFPMPHSCVGIIFENITVRKQVQEMVRKEAGRK